MNRQTKTELISSAFIIILCVIMFVVIIPNGISITSVFFSNDTNINSRTMPYIATFLIFASSMSNFIKTCINLKKETVEHTSEAMKKEDVIRLLSVMLLFVIYVALFCTVGTIVASVVVLPLILYVLGIRKISYYIWTYGVTAVCYFLFINVLQIYLP